MAEYEFQDETPSGFFSVSTQILNVLVRLIGIALLLVGVWVGVKVVLEAWNLYRNPDNGRIERVAAAINRGSNLDKLLTPGRSIAAAAPAAPATANPEPGSLEDDPIASRLQSGATPPPRDLAPADDELPFQPSYFLAWIIVFLLLLIIGRLAMAAVRTGGELALYDAQVKRFARALIEQTQSRARERR